jgi:hypothetical protein
MRDLAQRHNVFLARAVADGLFYITDPAAPKTPS